MFLENTGPSNPADTTNYYESNIVPCSMGIVNFENQILPIIKGNCPFSGCHSNRSAQDGVNLSDYNSVNAQIRNGKFFGLIIHNLGFVPMPYNQSKFDNCKIMQIKKWIDGGALNN